jgi:hypothetical protein
VFPSSLQTFAAEWNDSNLCAWGRFMMNTNHRTWQKHRNGYFLLSVHLDPIADGHNLQHDAELASITRQLLDLADSHRLPVTWAVSDPAFSAATRRILLSDVDHELAILGDANWLGPTAGRTRFARELARRITQSRGAGIHVKTLVPRVASVGRHIDLVVKQQITAISGVTPTPGSSWQTTLPRSIHYGVWELPISGCLPVETGRFRPIAWSHWRIWRRIRRAMVATSTYHLVIDAPALAAQGSSTVKSIGRLMRRIADWRVRGLVAVETLGMAADRLSAVPVQSPQRSILRRAA